jgi:CBS domain-containing protein
LQHAPAGRRRVLHGHKRHSAAGATLGRLRQAAVLLGGTMLQVKLLLAEKGSVVHAIGPDEPVLSAIQSMANQTIGALLVMQGDELVGIVSERDYARKIVLKGRSSSATPVRDIMTAPVISVNPADTVDTCMRLCTDSRVRHLPVVDQGRVVGVVSIGDLVKAVISEQGAQIEQLQRYIAG